MASKYIKDRKTDDKKSNKKGNETAFERRSKYSKTKTEVEERVVEEVKDFEESGYIKGSKRVRSYQSKVDEENRKKREAFQAELDRRREELLRQKREQAQAEGRADFEAGDFIVDEAELELEMHREGPTDLATTDFDPIEYDMNEYGLSTGEESEEILLKHRKKKEEQELSVKSPKLLSALKDNANKSLASEEKSYQHSVIATVLAGIILIILGVILQFANVHLPFMPKFVSLDFSALPELLAGVAYGPIVGTAVVLIKNILHSVVFFVLHGTPSYVNEISNAILDTLFVVFSSVVYNYYKGSQFKKSLLPNFREQLELGKKKLHHRSRFIFIGGTVGSAVVAIASLFSNVYLIFPLFEKLYSSIGINEYYFLKGYLDCNLNIENIMQGVLYYNVPYNFIRMYVVTIFVAVAYKPLSPLLHGQLKKIKK